MSGGINAIGNLQGKTDADGNLVVTLVGGGGNAPGGLTTQVQFNDAGAFEGDAGLVFDKTANDLTVAGAVNAATVVASSTVTAAGVASSSTVNITGAAGYVQMAEITAPAAGAANSCRLFVQDNGAGKTQLMAIFATGAAQQVAIQP